VNDCDHLSKRATKFTLALDKVYHVALLPEYENCSPPAGGNTSLLFTFLPRTRDSIVSVALARSFEIDQKKQNDRDLSFMYFLYSVPFRNYP